MTILHYEFYRIQKVAQDFLQDCKGSVANETQGVWFIGIHVRRTDYINHLNVTEGGMPVSGEFFHRAIDRMEQKLAQDFGTLPRVG